MKHGGFIQAKAASNLDNIIHASKSYQTRPVKDSRMKVAREEGRGACKRR
jgi:hypothetical protein